MYSTIRLPTKHDGLYLDDLIDAADVRARVIQALLNPPHGYIVARDFETEMMEKSRIVKERGPVSCETDPSQVQSVVPPSGLEPETLAFSVLRARLKTRLYTYWIGRRRPYEAAPARRKWRKNGGWPH